MPDDAKSLVVTMEDLDAKSPLPFVHWLMVNILPTVDRLPENVPATDRPASVSGALQGTNSKAKTGYYGPRPPAGDPPHQYHFQIFALDTTLDLPPGFNRHALLSEMEGHVLAKGDLVETFEKKN